MYVYAMYLTLNPKPYMLHLSSAQGEGHNLTISNETSPCLNGFARPTFWVSIPVRVVWTREEPTAEEISPPKPMQVYAMSYEQKP